MYFSILSARVVAALAAAAEPAGTAVFCVNKLPLVTPVTVKTTSAPNGVAALLLFALQLVADGIVIVSFTA